MDDSFEVKDFALGFLRKVVDEQSRLDDHVIRLTRICRESGFIDTQPPANSQSPPVRVTLIVTGPVDERVLADGVCRVRDGLEAWLAGHGYQTHVEVA